MPINLKNFELYSAGPGEPIRKHTSGESAYDALLAFGIDPEQIVTETVDYQKAVFRYQNRRYVLTDHGYA